MARRPTNWIPALCEGAYWVFHASGYRNAQVADVAARLGISVGAVYRHVDGKDMLFELALRWAFGLPIPDGPPPLHPIAFEELTRLIRERQSLEMDWSAIESRIDGPPPADAVAEMREILTVFFRIAHARRYGIRLLDRCFADVPALKDTHVQLVKGKAIEVLTRYVDTRARQGLLRAPGGAAMAGRAMMEMTAWMAIHRCFDPLAPTTGAPDADTEAALEAALGLACAGLAR